MYILGQNARKKAIERYSPARILNELETIYAELLGEKGLHFETSGDTQAGGSSRPE
jgi:hypothetical protein